MERIRIPETSAIRYAGTAAKASNLLHSKVVWRRQSLGFHGDEDSSGGLLVCDAV
jgi:hypothetical protein